MKGRGWIPVAMLAGVAVLGVFAFLTLGRGDRGERGARGRGPSESAGESPAAEVGRAAPLVEPSHPAAAERERPVTAATKDPSAAAPPAAFTRAVLVVAADSGRPVADAEVLVLDLEDWQPLFLERQVDKSPRYRTDTAGRVVLPFEGPAARLVVARAPGLLGGERLAPAPPTDTPARLALLPDWDVEVEVLAADGRPAEGVPLSLGLPGTSHGEETDAQGRASYPHVGYVCAASGAKAELGVRVPLEPPLFVTLAEAPTAPVRFRLPPLASVALTVLDAERAPVPDGTRLQLGLVRPGEARDVSPFARASRARLDASTSDGRASFAHVEPGFELELLVRVPGAVAERTTYFPGPARAGERLEHTLVLGLDQPVLEFRVLEAPGKPLVEAELELHLSMRSDFMRNEHRPEAHTDAEGRFRLELPGEFRAGGRRVLRVTARDESLGTRVDLARPFEPGLVPMGDLLLEPVPLVVAGRVTDGAGNAVAGARLELEGAVSEDDEDTRVWYWEALWPELVSGPDGTFARRGLVDAKRLRLRARAGEQRSAPVEARNGAEHVELVLHAVGALTGSLLLDPSVPAGELVLALFPESPELQPGFIDSDAEHEDRVRPDGGFTLDELVPGSYRFVVRTRESRPLAEVTGIQVVGGEESRDPRLQGLDLRAMVFARRFTLLFPAREEKAEGTLRFFPSGDERDQRHHWFDSNPFVLLTDLARFDGVLAVSGYRPVRLEGVNGDREVALVPSLRVRLVLPAEVVLPTPPTYVKAALAPLDDQGQLDWGAEVFDQRRESRSVAPGPGTLKVVWLLEERSAGSAMATTIELEPAQHVEVLDVGYEQSFELTVDPAALAEALARPR